MTTCHFIRGLASIIIVSILYDFNAIHALEYSPTEDLKQQIEAMEKTLFYQSEQILKLKEKLRLKLDKQNRRKITSTFNERVFVKEDID